MAYGEKYNLLFTNNLGETYSVLFRQKDYVGDSTSLTGTGEPLQIRSFNSDDDVFAPILSKECIINIHVPTTQNLGMIDFVAIADDEWNVQVYRELGQPPIFDGFLVVEDSSEPLLDKPLGLTIRCSDGLPLLKNVPLKKLDGVDFNGPYPITDYIGNILFYANPGVHFKVYYDIAHPSMTGEGTATFSPLEQMQVNARTFEKDEFAFIDCYATLETICSDLGCRLFYENGFWHIVSIWNYHKDTGYDWVEYEMIANVATKITGELAEIQSADVGKTQNIFFINKDANKFYKVSNKSVKLTYNYETPREILCNQSLKRGTLLPLLSGPGYEAIQPDCWDHIRWRSAFSPVEEAYIYREFDIYNYEKDSYLILPTETAATGSAHWMSGPFYISILDKIDISVETKIRDGYSGGQNSLVFYVLLFGDDGTFWTLDDNGTAPNNEGKWELSNFNFGINRQAISYIYTPTDDKTQWVTATVNSSPAPVTGVIQIVLAEHSFDSFPNESRFKNLLIDYHPYVRGSYRPVKGDYNLYEQNSKINKSIDGTVSISDSVHKILKGSILVNNLLTTPEWHRIGFTESLRFTQIQALIKYTYSYRQYFRIEGTLKGLSLYDTDNNNIPFGFLPQYTLTDLPVSPLTAYILTSLDINYLTGHWRGILVEVKLNEVATYDKYDFSYIF